MTKKIAALLLALCMLICLSACNKEETSSDISSDVSQTQITDSQTEESSETNTTTDTSTQTSENTDKNENSSTPQSSTSKPTNTTNSNTSSTSKPTESSKPSSTTSKPTETSKPTSSTPTTSTPTEEKKPISLSYSMLIENNGIVSKNRADVLATKLYINEDSNGNYTASYTIVGYTAFSITNISEQEKEAILNSAKNKDMLYDDGTSYGGAGAACLFSWDSSLLGYQYWPDLTYEKLVELGLYENITHDSNNIYLPSAFFGDTYVVCASDVSCSYDETTGKLDINGDFPFKDFYIGGTKQGNTYKINGIEKDYKEKWF